MLQGIEIRRIASEKKLALDITEKDYLLGWVLYGISQSTIRDQLIFKGGTALSKIYYPLNWRISEDLDFTAHQTNRMEKIFETLKNELPQTITKNSDGIQTFITKPLIHKDFLRTTIGITGPITRHRIKIEVTTEKTIGPYKEMNTPQNYDYPQYTMQTYTLENILAEKIRSLLERTRIRDYYDTWRLLKQPDINREQTKNLFREKCHGKEIEFKEVTQFFPANLQEELKPHFEKDLTRLTPERPPELTNLLGELRTNLEQLFQQN